MKAEISSIFIPVFVKHIQFSYIATSYEIQSFLQGNVSLLEISYCTYCDLVGTFAEWNFELSMVF